MGSPTQIMIATPGTRGRGARGLRLVENFKIGISSMDPWQGWAPCPPLLWEATSPLLRGYRSTLGTVSHGSLGR